ncbi:iron complex transport system substrate-binding protein [Andreprevotia lacus DSM 23236]|jgi:iron complex transport system substrate-binding protein|uniref:Iron complex transport system substrate-binding protein n=1 Tax=Andreprevotia lacus DSM 23236 TaxID=1121001 RepID=A0A1W1XPV9_9NEIS|nr:ABC transporter substrate-binding protein [Andreprevotia lacus]SMC25904.1 iron complex transport system substrate-binding protein [Andreprevotia lacus DSM 23236]
MKSLFLPALLLACLTASTAAWAARTITDANGTQLSVPDHPERILVLSELDLDAALALKIKPVGTTNGRGQDGAPRYLGAVGSKLVSVGNFGTPVLDKVIALQPDLILAGGLPDPELLAQLRRIAPTAVTYKLGDDWKAAFARIAQITARDAQAQSFMATYQQRLTQVRSQLGKQAGATVSVVRWNPQGPAYMLKDAFASLVLADLQLKRPAGQLQPGIAHSPPLSLEALNRIDADWLFIGTLAPAGQASSALASAKAMPAFQQLAAVKRQQMVVIDGSLWTSLGGPLAALAIVDDVDKAMVKR